MVGLVISRKSLVTNDQRPLTKLTANDFKLITSKCTCIRTCTLFREGGRVMFGLINRFLDAFWDAVCHVILLALENPEQGA